MNTSLKVALKYGIIVTVCLIAYFLLLKLFNFHENPWLRIMNGVIMSLGIYYAIKYYKLSSDQEFSYINGMKTGLLTGFIATVIFTVFMAVYMFHLDVPFTEKLLGDWFGDYEVSANILLLIVFIEGLTSTIVLSMAFMQLLKKSRNIPQKA
ncbi:DUF4199 domain-containing protein [Psychroserpens sp. XS_ASV72]|uniref:DUF4199 domain-containing protein n=1 Tax=Psychroserpens sp. XS_ASV72 TaxID=3241293 RepID=UPI0035168810